MKCRLTTILAWIKSNQKALILLFPEKISSAFYLHDKRSIQSLVLSAGVTVYDKLLFTEEPQLFRNAIGKGTQKMVIRLSVSWLVNTAVPGWNGQIMFDFLLVILWFNSKLAHVLGLFHLKVWYPFVFSYTLLIADRDLQPVEQNLYRDSGMEDKCYSGIVHICRAAISLKGETHYRLLLAPWYKVQIAFAPLLYLLSFSSYKE